MSGVTGWLDLSVDDPDAALATPDQIAFAQEVRDLLDRIGAPGLDRENADVGIWREFFGGALLIVLPLASSPHASIQLQMTSKMILGTWDDKHYLWDNTRDGEEELRVDGTDAGARRQALAWLDHEIRRPFVRRDTKWGVFSATIWTHDDDESIWIDRTGFVPGRPSGARETQVSVGFLDPPPA